MLKKIVTLVIIFLLLSAIIGVGKQLSDSLQSGKRISIEEEKVKKLQEENKKLKNELERTQTVTFVERNARDKLNLARPNETVFIIDQKLLELMVASSSAKTEESVPNWQGWMRLFI